VVADFNAIAWTKASVIKIRETLAGSWKHWALLVAIMALGIFARTWGYRSVASGLNQDEAENGVEAMNLYRYGADRNGVSFPTIDVKKMFWNELYGVRSREVLGVDTHKS
jgi:hypothetical protein